MESIMNKASCSLGLRTYPPNGQVCDDKRCLQCKDGSWQERFIDRIYGVGP